MTQNKRPGLRSPRIQRVPKTELHAPAAPETAAPEPGPRDLATLQHALGNAGFARMMSAQSGGGASLLRLPHSTRSSGGGGALSDTSGLPLPGLEPGVEPLEGAQFGAATAALGRRFAGGNGNLNRDLHIQRQHVQVASGRAVGDLAGEMSNRREDVLFVMNRLYGLWSLRPDQYDPEYPKIGALPAGATVDPAQIPNTIAGLIRNAEPHLHHEPARAFFSLSISAPVGRGQPNLKADIIALQNLLKGRGLLGPDGFNAESAAANAAKDVVSEKDMPQTLAALSRLKMSSLATTAELVPGVAPVTDEQKKKVDAVLDPAAGEAFVDVVDGKSYKQHLEAKLNAVVKGLYPSSKARLAAEKMPLQTMEDVGGRAKEVTDQKFGQLAMGPGFKAGPPKSGANLLDRSLETPEPADLTRYLLVNHVDLLPVHKLHKALPTGTQENAVIQEIIQTYSKDHASELTVIDQAWPAMAHGGIVEIQTAKGGTELATRQILWHSFQVLIHEYLHTVTHPNYRRLAEQLGGTKESILIEGGTSMFTDEVWVEVAKGLESNGGLRWAVEGKTLPYDPKAIPEINHYHQIGDARQIRDIVSPENFRAAYFLGKTEALGFAMQTPADLGNASANQTYTVPDTGISTLADVAFATGTTVEELARINKKPLDYRVRKGELIAVPGKL